MVPGRSTDPCDHKAADARQRRRLPGRVEPSQIPIERVVDGAGLDDEVESKGRHRVRRRERRGKIQEACPELGEALGTHARACRRGVAAVPLEQVCAGTERRCEVEAGRAARGHAPRVDGPRDHDAGHAQVLRQSSRDKTDDPHRPLAADHQRRRGGSRARRSPCLHEGGRGDVPARDVGCLQLRGEAHAAIGVVRQQQRRRDPGMAHAADRVEPRRDAERDGVRVDTSRGDASLGEKGRDRGPRVASKTREAEAHDGAVLAGHGDQVGDRADRREVRQIERRRPARHVPEHQLRKLERDAAA
jgi:hypothetical protein